MSAFFADFRFALRGWARKPGAPLSAVLMLALGIGAVTTVFAMAYVELWQPIPVRDPGQLENVMMRAGQMRGALLPDQYLALSTAPGLAGVAATQWQDPIALDPGASPTVTFAQVTPNMLSLLGLQPAWGRDFLPSEAAPGTTAPP